MDGVMDNRRRPTVEQWLATQKCLELAFPTKALAAAMLGCDVSAVYERAAAEGWKTPDFRSRALKEAWRTMRDIAFEERDGAPEAAGLSADAGEDGGDRAAPAPGDAGLPDAAAEEEPDDPLALLARASAFISRQITRLIASADRRGGRLDKAQIDGLAALARALDRWEALAREQAGKKRDKSIEELADIHRRIDDRIIEVAEAEALRLFEEYVSGRAVGGGD